MGGAAQHGGGTSKAISSQVLCDITGTRYYPNNEEIDLPGSKIVKVYDENNTLVGEMKF